MRGRIEGLQPPTTHATWMDDKSEPGLVTIVIPTYNRAHFLPDALKSVFQQSYRPIDVIIVDDGSTDGTKEIVDSFSEEVEPDKELSIQYHHQANQGAPVARNRGLIESTGEFIQFLDSDDILHPQKLDLQVNAFSRHPDADMIWSAFSRFAHGYKPQMEDLSLAPRKDLEVRTASQPGDASYPNGALFRRGACRRIGPWEETLERYQDWEYAFRIAALQLSIVRMDCPLYYARDHDTGSIGDSRFGEEGVARNLAALAAIDRVIESTPTDRPELHETAYRLYLNTLQRALTSGADTQVKRALQRAENHAIQTPRQLRTRVLNLLYRFAGARLTRWALTSYSRAKTGSAPAGNDPRE